MRQSRVALPFSRSLRSLRADDFRRTALIVAVCAAILAGWVVWAAVARVAVLAHSTSARLEVAALPHPIESSVKARIVSSSLVLGADVKEGDLLVSLDATTEKLALAEARARLAAL